MLFCLAPTLSVSSLAPSYTSPDFSLVLFFGSFFSSTFNESLIMRILLLPYSLRRQCFHYLSHVALWFSFAITLFMKKTLFSFISSFDCCVSVCWRLLWCLNPFLSLWSSAPSCMFPGTSVILLLCLFSPSTFDACLRLEILLLPYSSKDCVSITLMISMKPLWLESMKIFWVFYLNIKP